jgi:hypothetical protein
MATLYSNENFPLPVVLELRLPGHDVLTIQETGKGNQAVSDHEVLAFAASDRRAIFTINRKHFIRLHLASSSHAGIIVCTFDANLACQARRIHSAIQSQTDLTGKLLRVNRPDK